MEVLPAAILVVLLALLLALMARLGLLPRRITVFEYERGLKYVAGGFRSLLGPGQYWVFPFSTAVTKIDIRPRFESLTGQEVLSADGVALRVSIAAKYEVTDPHVAVLGIADYATALHLELQLSLREIIGTASFDDVLQKRDSIGERLAASAGPRAERLGVTLLAASIKDVMLPGDLKRIYTQVVKARQEGLAALEKARGETAALRNLANAARMVEEHPVLMQLRLLQQVGDSSGNTMVLGMPSTVTPFPVGAPPPARGRGALGQGETEPPAGGQ